MPMMLTANGMLRAGTPIESHPEYGLDVKREDLSCPPPGPPFSKTRGVWAWCAKQEAPIVGVLDTVHSQGGHAVARACQLLGKQALVFYPRLKNDPGPREPQHRAAKIGAELIPLPGGRSAVLYHAAKKATLARGGVMIPNALKLEETVAETAKEVPRKGNYDYVLIPASSGTIAAGVIKGFSDSGRRPVYLIHLGYSRSEGEVRRYLTEMSGYHLGDRVRVIDEGYAYKDPARPGETPPWPSNSFYDLKAFRWWRKFGHLYLGKTLFWNVG